MAKHVQNQNFLHQAEISFVEDFYRSFPKVDANQPPNVTNSESFFARWSGYMAMHCNALIRQETDPYIIFGVAGAVAKRLIARRRSIS